MHVLLAIDGNICADQYPRLTGALLGVVNSTEGCNKGSQHHTRVV
jgi:hypothetical protein